jgi:peptidyl-dipeptidase Dcp
MEELAALTTRFAQNVLHDESSWRLVLRGEPSWPACPTSCGPRRARRRWIAACPTPRDHAVALADRALPDLLGPARPARAGLARLGAAANTTASTTTARWRATSCACATSRRGCTARQLRRLRAGRHHGRHAAPCSSLLDEVWPRALAACGASATRCRREVAVARRTGAIEAWDWRYWAEKVRQARYAVDDAEVKPYFPLDRDGGGRLRLCRPPVRPAASWRATTCRSTTRTSRPTRCATPTVGPVGVFLQDNFARPSKRSGAWMSAALAEPQCATPPAQRRPIGDPEQQQLRQGAPGEPTLLSLDDARTLFHEFGHGLHGLLSDVTYERLSGTRCCATSSSCRRSCSSTGSPSPRCSSATPATGRPASRFPTR